MTDASDRTAPARYSVEEVIETGSLSPPVFKVIGLCFLLMTCDSYDVGAIAYAAPVLIKDWLITPGAMGLVFSAGLFGLLVGSVVLGRAGDRIGRKRAIVIGALCFSILTMLTGLAGNVEQLVILRFFAALGLGGAVPNAVALTGEFAPKASRATAVGLIFAGYSLGGILAGLTAAMVVPAMGWPPLFFFGGGISLLATAAIMVFLPESLAYLAGKPKRQLEARRLAMALRPDLPFASSTQILGVAKSEASTGLRQIFAGPLALATPLIWLAYIASSLTVFSLASWMPVAVEALGLPRAAAASATALLFAGSAVGGVLGGRLVDRFGLRAMVLLALAAFPAVSAIGLVGSGSVAVFGVSFLAGMTAFGVQTCLHGFVGSLYPADVRASGVGWAIGIAKVGSIMGPIIGGILLPRLDSFALFISAATPMLAVALILAALSIIKPRTGVVRVRTERE